MSRRAELQRLTARWRARHDARRPSLDRRPNAEPDREALAIQAFPYRSVAPAAYVRSHGHEMAGFTFDDHRYADPELDAWIVEVGRLLRSRRDR